MRREPIADDGSALEGGVTIQSPLDLQFEEINTVAYQRLNQNIEDFIEMCNDPDFFDSAEDEITQTQKTMLDMIALYKPLVAKKAAEIETLEAAQAKIDAIGVPKEAL